MNKIILFVIVLILGSVISKSMVAIPNEKVTDITFECTIKSIQHCGTKNEVCLENYMKECQQHTVTETSSETTTTETTINVSHHVDHKKHHAYKTSIIVKEDEEEETNRICITDTNCNCEEQAKEVCSRRREENCVAKQTEACQTRCRNSRRCYQMDCSDAGKTRCDRDIQLECALKHPESTEDRISCVQKKLSCCQRYEKATCKRALRVYKFRTACEEESKTKCSAIVDEEEKCNCITKTRHSCLVNKVEKYRQSIRQVFNCEESASMICSEKKCGTEYDLCVKREKSICEPVCEKESRVACNNQVNGVCYEQAYKKCVHKWRRTYCEKRAEFKCGEDYDCLKAEKHICKRDVPSCMTGEVSCDDKNKCTEDICDPTKGCINKPINCDDNNACTTESCDPLLGCVYRTKKCDDGKLCTRDSCNPRTGECKYVYDNTICHVCQNGYCEKDQDCAAWEKSAKLEESCQKAICDAQYGSCQAVHVKGCANKCRKSCQPYHACDTATCVLNKVTSEYECVHTEKKCDDHKSCTIDSCDLKLGCVHKLNKEVCPPNPICENDSECASWETSNNLKNKCQKAVCDKHKGICLAVSTSQECDESVCKKTCQPRHACETVQCQKNKDGKYQCAKQPVICDDKKECTVDTCDEKVGCVFKYKADDNKCKPNCQCEHNADCKQYELTEKLVDRCLKAVCDPKLGACVTEPIDKNCDRELKECQLKCKSSSKCIESVCVKDEGNRYVCQPTSRKCDDGIECTVDSCDENLGCVHKYKADDVKCPTGGECKRDAECITWGFTQKLGQQCKRPVCDLKTGACKAVPKEKPCTTVTQCQLTCKAQNPCETATCVLNTEGDFTCKRVSKLCPGSEDPCNIPSCDIVTGNCVITRLQSDKCNKCTKQSDCEALNKKVAQDCNSAVCDPATQTCKVLPLTDKKCVDEKVCKKTCVASNNCEVATCVYDETTKKHTCKKTPSSEKSCLPLTQCELNCKPASLCESASCSKQTDGTYTCLRSVNTCNDNKSCTKDSCDVATGKCVNTYVVSDKCPPNAQCDKNLDCVKWASQQELDICLTPVCDTQTGACKAVSNKLKCSSKTCDLKCPPRNKCEESTCAYDSNNKLVCEYKRKSCDDKNRCTIDSCDENKGCVNTFDVTIPGCNTPRCETPKDCVKYAQDNKLADDCKDAICDSETKTCRAVLINNVKCNPYLNKCRRDCAPRDACETAECIVDASTKAYTCLRKPITCNDNNACTVDVCDKVKGCKYTYTISERCEQYCEDNNDCVNYGLKKQASLSCQVPYCDKKTTSCRLQEDPNKNCKKIENKCEKDCKPKDACHTSRCVRKGDNEFTCVQEKITCDDGQTCTEDSCDVSKGCQFRFKESATCRRPCKVDIDCDSWAITEKLADKCEKARCSRKLGSCVAVKGLQSEKCKTTDICKLNNDCPQGKFGTVCCKEGGLNKCCDNECEVDSDCVPKDKKKEWGYCRVRDSGKRECEFKPKCTGNEGCDDKNPCTKDICLTEYGFCKNIRRCVDNSECTLDICEPGKDGKTYTCKNPTKSCTNDKTLLDKDFNLLTPEQKTKWLGKCSHLEGCVSCVVNAQCDDNNGCTKDSCVNQFCVSTPIDNKWCDPKLKGQAITVQGYFPKFTRL